MKKIVLGICFLLCWVVGSTQTYSKCKVYQFAGTDSSKKFVAETINYTMKGQIISEIYKNYKKNSQEGTADGSYFYFYKDTLLVKRTQVDDNKDSSKALYTYNEKGQLIKEEHWSYEKRLKKLPEGEWGSDVKTAKDYEKNKTWALVSVINHTYDSAGHEIEYYAPEIHWDNQNRYTWKYNSAGKVIEYCSYHDKTLLWIKTYTYFENGYSFTRAWYNYDGTKKDGDEITYTFKLDSKGRETEETLSDANGKLLEKTTTAYNSKGQIARTVCYNIKGIPAITHIYVYAHE